MVEIDCHPDIVYSACFNWDGSKLLTTCKDKKIRIINPRTGEIETEAICHEGEFENNSHFLHIRINPTFWKKTDFSIVNGIFQQIFTR